MRKPFAALACLAFAASPAAAQRSATARETSPDALQQVLDRGEKVLVIDVRCPLDRWKAAGKKTAPPAKAPEGPIGRR